MDNFLELEDEPQFGAEPEAEVEPEPEEPPPPPPPQQPKVSIALDPAIVTAEVQKAQTTVASLRRELATKSVEVAQLGRVLTMYTQTGGTPTEALRLQVLEANIKEANDRHAQVVAENAILLQRSEMLIAMHTGQGQFDMTPILRDAKVQQLQRSSDELQKQLEDATNALTNERSNRAQVGKLEEDWHRQRDELQAQIGLVQQQRDEAARQMGEQAREIEDMTRQMAARDEQIRDLTYQTSEEAQSAQYQELTKLYDTALGQARELENLVAAERSQKEQAVAAWQEYTRKQADDARLHVTALQGRVAQLELDLKAAAAGGQVTVSMDTGKITSLEQLVRDTQGRLNEANRKLAESESRAAAAEARVGSLETALQDQRQVSSEASANDGRVAQLEHAYAAAVQRSQELEAQLVAYQQSLLQHQQALQQYQAALQQLQQSVAQEGGASAATQAHMAQLEQALAAQQQQTAALTAQLQQSQVVLQQTHTALQQSQAAQQQAEAALQQTRTALQQAEQAAQNQGDSQAAARVAELEARLASVDATVQELQATNTALTSAAKRVTDLEGQLQQAGELARDQEKAAANAAGATQQVAELQATLAARASEISQLRAQLQKAEDATTNANMSSGHRAHELEKTVSSLQSALEAMEQEKNAAQARLDQTITSNSKVQTRMLEELAQLRSMADHPGSESGVDQSRVRELEAQVAELETQLGPLEEERRRLLPRIKELEAQLASGGGGGEQVAQAVARAEERLRAQVAEQAAFTMRLLATMQNFITKAQEEVKKRTPQKPPTDT